jgi:hypothetical protein
MSTFPIGWMEVARGISKVKKVRTNIFDRTAVLFQILNECTGINQLA